jgi:hypothetical protein
MNVVVISSCDNIDPVPVNKILSEQQHMEFSLEPLNDHAGGKKWLEVDVYAFALNYGNIGTVRKAIDSGIISRGELDFVTVIIIDQDDFSPTILTLL